jgi:hypothetical protein
MRTLAVAVVLSILGACAVAGGKPAPTVPKGSGLVLKIETGGGFVPPEFHLRELPSFALYADGRAITQGPQIMIYPGPALPNLLVRMISPKGVAAILQAAAKAGLTGAGRDFSQAQGVVTDMPTTTFTTVSSAGRHRTTAYGFEFLKSLEGLTPQVSGRVRALDKLVTSLQDLQSWLPKGSVGEEVSYEPSAMRVFVAPQAAQEEPQPSMPWPLDQALATFGAPADAGEFNCGVVEGEDLAKLLPAAQKANTATPWESGGALYSVVFRPLLPDESWC